MDYAGYVKSFYKYSVKYFGIAAVLNCRTGEQYSNDLCTHYIFFTMQTFTIPSYCQKRNTAQMCVLPVFCPVDLLL